MDISLETRVATRNDSLLQDNMASGVLSNSGDAQRAFRKKVNAQRLDAVAPGNGIAFARDLEHIYNEVVREDYEPNNAMRLFPTNSSVNENMQKHTVRRVSHTGKAEVYRGSMSTNPPGRTASVAQDEESFDVATYVTAIRIRLPDRIAARFTNTDLRSELSLAANQALMDLANDKTFDGDDDHRILGVLNYPYVPKTVSTVDMTSSGTPSDQLAELHRLASEAAKVSKGKYMPDTLVMSIETHDYLSQTKLSLDSEQGSILSEFLADNKYINQVEPVHEMSDAGPGGEEVLFFYRRGNRMAIENVIPQAPRMLPVRTEGYGDLLIPLYMRHGGIIMRKPLNNLVCYLQ